MSDPSDTTAPRRRKRRRKAPAATPSAEPAVQVILEQALHPDPAALDAEAEEAEAPEVEVPEVEVRGAATPAAKGPRRRGGRAGTPPPSTATTLAQAPSKRRGGKAVSAASAEAAAPEGVADVPAERPAVEAPVTAERVEAVETQVVLGDAIDVESAPEIMAAPPADTEAPSEAEPVPEAEPAPPISDWHDVTSAWTVVGDGPETPPSAYRDEDGEVHHDRQGDDRQGDAVAPHDDAFGSGHASPPAPPAAHVASHAPVPHHWVYLAVGLFVAALGFGVWGVWTVFFSGGDGSGTSLAALRTRSDRLSQEVSTLRRSDQISRDANRDLERTLAERDEEIASLRADIAFYERFVGATGQRRGLSVHDLEMRRQDGDAWHFVATLTQNVNRGAVNSGRLTLSIEGTRRDRMERLSWTTLRKQPNAPGAEYSFKYFQQLEGEILLPADFKPLRVTVRLVPQGGAAVEQSFPWPETLHSVAGG